MKTNNNTLERLDWEVINDYIARDLLIKQKHPTKDLWILNYSKTAQFERAWDLVTLSCRGMVVNSEGDIIARPFKKFFNKEEHEALDTETGNARLDSNIVGSIPKGLKFEVFEKMDGSLGLMFFYEDEWIFASRGSFTSEQAIKGREIYKGWFGFKDGKLASIGLDKKYTYIFEIIYPENRIVVNYDNDEDLVLLGAINTTTGNEMSYNDLSKWHKHFTIVPRYDGINDVETLKGMELDNKEGFVVRFSNGFRMKVKFEEYCRLHSIVTNVSNKIIWEHLMYDLPFEDILDRVPDEFYEWVLTTKVELQGRYYLIENLCHLEHKRIVDKLDINLALMDVDAYDKAYYFSIKEDFKYKGIVLAISKGKDYSETIWKLIKPKHNTPFKGEVEG